MTFPVDLDQFKYYISFDFREFERRSLGDRIFYPARGNVRLPIPANLIDNQSVEWGVEAAGPLVGTVVDMQYKTRSQFNLEGVTDAVNNILSLQTGKAVAAQIAQTVGGRNTALYTGIWGLTINPFMTVLFQSPTFKKHSFQWRLSPQNDTESDIVRNIVAKFRYNMLPEPANVGGSGGLVLKYPNMCYVTLYPADQYLYHFKPCVVESIQVNFAPQGPAFYKTTSAPGEVILSVNLLEIEYWMKEDVDKTWNKSSGGGPSPVISTRG